MLSRIISGVIAIGYLTATYFMADGAATFRCAIYLIFPLACIWFSEAMGDYAGSTFGARPAITQTTPGCFVAFGGWVLLLMPMIAGLIMMYLSERN